MQKLPYQNLSVSKQTSMRENHITRNYIHRHFSDILCKINSPVKNMGDNSTLDNRYKTPTTKHSDNCKHQNFKLS